MPRHSTKPHASQVAAKRASALAKAAERDAKQAAARDRKAGYEPGAKLKEARASLSVDLRATFDALVSDYQFAATEHNRHPFYSPFVLADLVRAGWRREGVSATQAAGQADELLKVVAAPVLEEIAAAIVSQGYRATIAVNLPTSAPSICLAISISGRQSVLRISHDGENRLSVFQHVRPAETEAFVTRDVWSTSELSGKKVKDEALQFVESVLTSH